MLNRVFEWYQMVNPTPADEVINHRTASVTSLVAAILEKEDYEILIQLVAAAVSGLDRGFTQETPLISLVVQAIREHQSAFPEDLSENALEVRACCALVVGEILAQSGSATDRGDSVLAAGLLTSALGIRPMPAERYLKRVLEELRAKAASVLVSESTAKRQRTATSLEAFDGIAELTAIPELCAAIQKAMKTSFAQLEKQAAADREELDILWWMFTGYSFAAGKPLTELDPAAAALCCAGELASLVVVPPSRNTCEMVQRAIATGRKPAALAAKSLDQIAKSWDAPIVSLFIPEDDNIAKIIQSYPSLFPLSSLCRRLRDSEFAEIGGSDIERLTGIPATHAISPRELGVQAFNERIAQRIYQS